MVIITVFTGVLAGSILGCLLPLEARVAPSGTVKASPQREDIHVGSRSGLSGHSF